jgi:hypothetical protein
LIDHTIIIMSWHIKTQSNKVFELEKKRKKKERKKKYFSIYHIFS